MRSRYSIRALLSALVYSVSALLGVVIYVYSGVHTISYILAQQTEQGQDEAIQFGRWIENELMQGESMSEEFQIMAMTTLPDEGHAILLESSGEPLDTDDKRAEKDHTLAGLSIPADLRARALRERRTQTHYDEATRQLYFLQPFALPPAPGELRGLNQGLLLLQYDLSQKLEASARQVTSTAIGITVFLALLSLGLVRLFSRLITNRLEKLVAFARANRPTSETSLLNASTLDEIEELAASFEVLVEKLRQVRPRPISGIFRRMCGSSPTSFRRWSFRWSPSPNSPVGSLSCQSGC